MAGGATPMDKQKSTLNRPQLTLPPLAAQLVREEYAKAKVILEYGSGGSTVVAGDVPGTTAFAVESDKSWAAMMEAWFAENPPVGKVQLHYVDIGPTREWGYPTNFEKWKNFVDYPFSIWERSDFLQPDLVLIDGRFRVGCFLATIMNTKKEINILFDDYTDRPAYHVVEKFCKKIGSAGRMAIFKATPLQPKPHEISSILRLIQEEQ